MSAELQFIKAVRAREQEFHKMRVTTMMLCAAILAAGVDSVLAQAYPSRPIRVIVPFPPGAYTDFVARLVGQKLNENWGQPVVVENRPGAGGNIGADAVAKAEPNGYTLLMGTIASAISVSLYRKLPYDLVNDLVPVTLVVLVPNVLVVHPSLPARSVRDFIQLTKSNPGQLNYASSGNGSAPHLAAEMFKMMAHVEMAHVPYKGISPAMTDLVSGQVPLMFTSVDSALPQVKAGKLRALAVTSARRSSVLPDLPTMAESGLPGFEVTAWGGILAPARTPREIINALNIEIVKILRVPDVKERLSGLGAEPVGDTPEQFVAFINAEIAKWAKVVKASGARVD